MSADTPTVPVLWEIKDVCAYFQISRTTVWRLMKQVDNPIPYVRPGGPRSKPRFDPEEVRRWAGLT